MELSNFSKYYYAHLMDQEIKDKNFVIEDSKRKKTTVYTWNENGTWVFNKTGDNVKLPEKDIISIEDILTENQGKKITDKAEINIREPHKKLVYELKDGFEVRELNENDSDAFKEFLDKCSEDDKEQGQVNVDDDLVYGVLKGNEIVSVASYWYWGDKIADVGVLTVPEYRGLGLIMACVSKLVDNTDKITLWRASDDNKASKATAKKLGFINAGSIFEIEDK